MEGRGGARDSHKYEHGEWGNEMGEGAQGPLAREEWLYLNISSYATAGGAGLPT